MPRITSSHQRYYRKFLELGRILTDEEAFDFYVEKIMRNDPKCYFNRYANRGKGKYEDYKLWELEAKAVQWHQHIIGSLVRRGLLVVNIKEISREAARSAQWHRECERPETR